MTQRFTDRVAVVTGAGGGIGEAYARALHAEGASVVIAELNKEAGLQLRLISVSAPCSFIPTSAISAAARRWPPPRRKRSAASITSSTMRRSSATWRGSASRPPTRRTSRPSCESMCWAPPTARGRLSRRCGSEVADRSSTSRPRRRGCPFGLLGVAKAALNSVTVCLAQELGSQHIRVNAIAPGPTDTPAMQKQVPAEFHDMLVQSLALKRMGTPGDHVGPVLFLLSDEAAWITGQVLAVYGRQIPRI